MSDPIPPLDPRWLAELGDDRPPPGDAADRVWSRLAASLPIAGPGGAPSPDALRSIAPSPGRAVDRRPTRAWAWHLVTFTGGCFVGVAVAGALWRAPTRVEHVDRPAVPAIVTTPIDPSPPEAAPDTPPLPVELPVTRNVPGGSVSSASQLAAERRLLDAARASISAGEPEKALAKLEQHRARFPHGILSEERDAMFVLALARAGRDDEAKARASAFLQRSTDSLFRSVVRNAIQSISVTKNPAESKLEDGGYSP